MKSFTAVVGIFCLITTVLADGELSILHSPKGILFQGNEPLKTSELPLVLSTALGHSLKTDNTWNGLSVTDPFKYPNVVIVVAVEGVTSLGLGEHRYPLRVTKDLQATKDDFSFTLGSIVMDENDLFSGNFLDSKLTLLSANNEATAQLVKDLGVLKDLNQKVKSKSIDSVWVNLNGLSRIVGEYGQDSDEAVEAGNLLKDAVQELKDNLKASYGDKFLLTSITDDKLYTMTASRVKRDVSKDSRFFVNNTQDIYKLNISKRYSSDYSSIFNIILWTSIFLLAALITTAVFICTLDPGRDSIIYRMTTQRIKKDN